MDQTKSTGATTITPIKVPVQSFNHISKAVSQVLIPPKIKLIVPMVALTVFDSNAARKIKRSTSFAFESDLVTPTADSRNAPATGARVLPNENPTATRTGSIEV